LEAVNSLERTGFVLLSWSARSRERLVFGGDALGNEHLAAIIGPALLCSFSRVYTQIFNDTLIEK